MEVFVPLCRQNTQSQDISCEVRSFWLVPITLKGCLGLIHVYESPHKDGNARCVCVCAFLLKLCACSFVNTAISILLWIKICELHPLPGNDELLHQVIP